ncbi:hypothetical protein CATMQ487_32250 [Sphaerotilus microaerophilus]|uniref:Uncharacterized protein n=1 Tax=Sphaerotilus microaerophilus TaxID=2914710 RepID=A0ABN6PSQ1_9BURK|nr:hypothetical protein CATMQ487_32250 [Sphaerotilus sp. FB-5]
MEPTGSLRRTAGQYQAADPHIEELTLVGGRRRSLTHETPGLRELLSGYDEAILDPQDTCCRTVRGGTTMPPVA